MSNYSFKQTYTLPFKWRTSNHESFGNSFGNSLVSLSLCIDQTRTALSVDPSSTKIINICERKTDVSRSPFLKTTVGTQHPLQDHNCPSFGGTHTVRYTPRREASFKWRTNIFIRDDLLAVILEQLYLRLFTTMVQNGKSPEVWEVWGAVVPWWKVWDWKMTWFKSQVEKAWTYMFGQTYVGEIPSPNPLP